MEQLIYAKYSDERSVNFSMYTEIWEDEDGRRWVVKKPESSQAKNHLENIKKSYDGLKQLYEKHGVGVNRCKSLPMGDGLEFEYLYGRSYENIVDAILSGEQTVIDEVCKSLDVNSKTSNIDNIRCTSDIIDISDISNVSNTSNLGKLDSDMTADLSSIGCNEKLEDIATAVIKKYIDTVIPKEELQPFELTDEFKAIFGEQTFAREQKTLPITNIDMVLANMIHTEDGNQMFDYEWTFDFPIPVSYVIYRIVMYYTETSVMRAKLRERNLYSEFGILQDEIDTFVVMERNFQHYIEGERIPIRNMHADISPGAIPATTVIEGYLQKRREQQLQVFYSYGDGYSEANSQKYPMQDGRIDICIDLPDGVTDIRIDPGEKHCLCRINELSGVKKNHAVMQFDTPGLVVENTALDNYLTDDNAIGDGTIKDSTLADNAIECGVIKDGAIECGKNECRLILFEDDDPQFSISNANELDKLHINLLIEAVSAQQIAVLKSHIKAQQNLMEEQQNRIESQENQIEEQQNQIKAQADQIEALGARLAAIEATKAYRAYRKVKKVLKK